MTGTVTCVVQVIPALEEIGKVTTHPGSVGSLFWTWFVAVTVAQGLANHQLRLSVRVLLLGLALLALGHGLLQVRSWASGWLPPLVAIGVIVTAWRPRLTIALATLAVPVGLYLVGDVATDVLTQESYSLSTRQEAWAVLWQIVKRSPMLGTGLANYYYFAENYPILGWYVPFISHNNYQDLLVQTGVVGLLAFSWFALEAVWLAFRLLRYLPPGFPMAYALGTLGGVVGSLASGMLGDWIIPFYYNAGVIGFRSSLLFWVFLGGALALRRMGAVPQPDYSLAHADVPSGQYALAGFR
jgi:O-antigen ligase